MIGELNSSHTYHGGGDLEDEKNKMWVISVLTRKPDGDFYKIKKIIRGAPWDAEERSPLDMPGVNIPEGELYYWLSMVLPLTTAQEPFGVFPGLAR